MAENLVNNIPHIQDASMMKEQLAPCPSIVDDLKNIYSNKFLTDVNLKTKTNLFPAHKIVLSARSPVFKRIFTVDAKCSDDILVENLEDDIIQQMLQCIYTDNIEDLQWEPATKLYYAAVKYKIEKLKLICSSFFIENLTVSTAPDLLLLAQVHHDFNLKKVVDDFILEHEQQVYCSNEWEHFMKSCPKLALKTMHLKYKQKRAREEELRRMEDLEHQKQLALDGVMEVISTLARNELEQGEASEHQNDSDARRIVNIEVILNRARDEELRQREDLERQNGSAGSGSINMEVTIKREPVDDYEPHIGRKRSRLRD